MSRESAPFRGIASRVKGQAAAHGLEHRLVDGCAVVEIKEDRFEYPKTQVLKNYVLRLLEEGVQHVTLNLTNVQMLDSFGIAVFISILKACKRMGQPHAVWPEYAGHAPDGTDAHGSRVGYLGKRKSGRRSRARLTGFCS